MMSASDVQNKYLWENGFYHRASELLLDLGILYVACLQTWAEPGSSVGSNGGSQSRGCEFESQLGWHSFRRLRKVTVTCVIRLSPMGFLTVFVEKQPVAWKVCCVVYWCGKTRKRMSRWTGCRDMTEKLLKKALNPNQSNNQHTWILYLWETPDSSLWVLCLFVLIGIIMWYAVLMVFGCNWKINKFLDLYLMARTVYGPSLDIHVQVCR